MVVPFFVLQNCFFFSRITGCTIEKKRKFLRVFGFCDTKTIVVLLERPNPKNSSRKDKNQQMVPNKKKFENKF